MTENDGIVSCNNITKRLESLITVDKLKAKWLFGVNIIDNAGNSMPDSTLQEYINTAVSMLEHDLDIPISPRKIREEKDYFANDYWEWGYFQLNNYPVISVESIRVEYLAEKNPDTGEIVPVNVLDIPPEWYRLRQHDGLIRLIPNNRFPANLQIDAGGSFFPELFRRHSMVPQLWGIEYTAGFEGGKIPVLINTAIGLIAGIMALNIAGDLILGAGIAGSSLSLDGLSQSIQTTSSAENHGYSAKVKEYQSILFGDPRNPGILKSLRQFYQGERLNII